MSDRCKRGGGGWLVLLAAVMLLAGLAFSCDRGPLHRVRLSEPPPPGPALLVFYLDRDLDEGALKKLVQTEVKPFTDSHPYVEAYVFYDQGFAKKFGSDRTIERIMKTGSTPGGNALFDPELKIQGGAFLAVSPENPLGAWAYFPRREPPPNN